LCQQKEHGYRNGELLVTVISGDDQRLKRFVQAPTFITPYLQRGPSISKAPGESRSVAAVQRGYSDLKESWQNA
jgi:hypothetical protein